MLMSDQPTPREPVFNMPSVVLMGILLLAGCHAGRMLLSDEADFGAVLDFGFVPAQWSVLAGWASVEDVVGAAAAGAGNLAELRTAFARYVVAGAEWRAWSPLSYALLHGSWMHVGLNCVWFAAFATPVVRRCGTWRWLLLMAVTALGGALAHWLAHPLGVQPMIGASAVVSGMMGAAAMFVFDRPEAREDPGMRRARFGDMLGRMIRNRTALLFLGSWFAMNLAFGLLAGPLGIVDAGIAWEAHIGGLVAGIAAFPLLASGPPSWQNWPRGA